MNASVTLWHLLQRLLSVLEMPIRYIFGRDIFISYSRADGGKYAPNLALALQAKRPKLSFYLDKWIAPPDNKLPRSLKRHLRWSSILVLVCTENAVKSDFVRDEIRSFARLGRKIVPISVNGSFFNLKNDEDLWPKISGASPEDESREAITEGRASETVIERVIESVRFSIQDQRLRRAVWSAVCFVVLSIGGAIIFSAVSVRKANAKVASAEIQRIAAEVARKDADTKKAEAEQATIAANQKTADAVTLQGIAEGQATDAETKRTVAEGRMREARRLEEQARENAKEQERIAKSSRLAGLADRNLLEKPDLSLLLGASAYDSSSAQRSFEAKRSLLTVLSSYRNLDFLLSADKSLNTGIVVTPDQRTLIASNGDGKVFFWDLAKKKIRSVHDVSPFPKIALTPDGHALVAASGETIDLWDVKSESKRGVLKGQGSGCFAIRPDSKILISSSNLDELVIWNISDLDDPREVHRFKYNQEGAQARVQSIVFSADGRTLLTGGTVDVHGSIVRWNVTNLMKPERIKDEKLQLSGREVSKLVYSPTGKYFVSIQDQGAALLWKSDSLESKTLPLPWNTFYTDAAFSNSGDLVVSTLDGTVFLLNPNIVWTGVLHSELVGTYQRGVGHATLSLDGFVVSGNSDGTIAFWRTDGPRKLIHEIYGFEHPVTVTAFTRDGRLLASGDAAGNIMLKDLVAEGSNVPLPKVHTASVLSLDFDEVHGRLASGGDDGKLVLWTNGVQGWQPKEFPVGDIAYVRSNLQRSWSIDVTDPARLFSVVRFMNKGRNLITIGPGPFVVSWDVESKRVIGSPIPLPGLDSTGTSLSASGGAISSDGKLVAVGYSDGSIQLLNTREGNTNWQTLRGHDGEVTNVAFSRDGNSLVSADDDTNVVVWQLGASPVACQSFKPALDYPPDAEDILSIESVAFGQDDQTLAFGSSDSITLWDLKSGSTIGSLELSKSAEVKTISFSPDGTKIAMGGDRVVLLFNANAQAWAEAARTIANRQLSEQERQFYDLDPKMDCASKIRQPARPREDHYRPLPRFSR